MTVLVLNSAHSDKGDMRTSSSEQRIFAALGAELIKANNRAERRTAGKQVKLEPNLRGELKLSGRAAPGRVITDGRGNFAERHLGDVRVGSGMQALRILKASA